MALFSPFWPRNPNDLSLFDFDDHPFLNMNSSFFRDANFARANRANVSETETEYKMEIEVPGYQKSEIAIEFGNDGKSLTVSGKTEKSFEQRPTDVTVEEVPEYKESKESKESKKPSTTVAEANKEKAVAAPAAPKYWISERTSGSFSRTFTFRSLVDPDRTSASLENGVLNVTIPKMTASRAKKISIA